MVNSRVLAIASILLLGAILARATVPDWIPPEMLDLVADDKKRCMELNGVEQATIDKVNDGTMEYERNLKCYMFCLLESFSLVEEDGSLEADLLVSFLPENIQADASRVLTSCLDVGGDDGCEKVYNTGVCVQKSAPHLWFLL